MHGWFLKSTNIPCSFSVIRIIYEYVLSFSLFDFHTMTALFHNGIVFHNDCTFPSSAVRLSQCHWKRAAHTLYKTSPFVFHKRKTWEQVKDDRIFISRWIILLSLTSFNVSVNSVSCETQSLCLNFTRHNTQANCAPEKLKEHFSMSLFLILFELGHKTNP